MSLEYLLMQMVNGLILGSMYALVAIGFTMIYGIIRLINFAHGEVVMIGAFSTLGLMAYGNLPFPLVVVAVLLVGAGTGVLIERAAFRPMRDAPQVTGFIASLALSIMLQNLGVMILSGQPRNFTFPDYLRASVSMGPLDIRVIDLCIIGLALGSMGALMLFVSRTRMGRAMRATAQNLEVARLMGINANRVIMTAFALGSALAALGGLMWGGKYGQIDPLLGFVPGLKSFVAAVIGGVGSIPGAIMGGYILGFSEILFVGLLPPAYASYRDAFVFGLLIVILLILPDGLLGSKSEDRA
jgi:branched-chain amino acid transport system permease protein